MVERQQKEKNMVRAVRGATTVESNNADEIIKETGELLKKIIEENSIKTDDIISAFFSVTRDLDAVFPAVAARQLGWTNIALMCTNEIDVPGSLEKCIRVLIHFNTDKKNEEMKYIYLKQAKSLRPDLAK
jgi:chorismate mutase